MGIDLPYQPPSSFSQQSLELDLEQKWGNGIGLQDFLSVESVAPAEGDHPPLPFKSVELEFFEWKL